MANKSQKSRSITPSGLGFWYYHDKSAQVARLRIAGDNELIKGKEDRLREASELRLPPVPNQYTGHRYEARIKWLTANKAAKFIDFEPGEVDVDVLFDHPPTPKDLNSLAEYVPVSEDAQNMEGSRAALAWAQALAHEIGSEGEPIVIWQPSLEGELGVFAVEDSEADVIIIWPLNNGAVRVRTIDIKSTKLTAREEKKTGQVMQTVAYAELIDPVLNSLTKPYEMEVGVWTRDEEPNPSADLTPETVPEVTTPLSQLRDRLRRDLGPDGDLVAALDPASAKDVPLPPPSSTSGPLAELYAVHAWDRDSAWPTLLLTGLRQETCEYLDDEYGIGTLEDLATLLPPPHQYVNNRGEKPKPWHDPIPFADNTGRKIEEDPTIGVDIRKKAQYSQVLLGVVDPNHKHAYIPDHSSIYENWAWYPGNSAAPLPSMWSGGNAEPAMSEDAVRVYLNIGINEQHKRPWAIAARCSSGSDPRDSVTVAVEEASDWYDGSRCDDDIERELVERAATAILDAIQDISQQESSYVHFYVYESKEHERLLEALDRHESVAQPVDALRHLLSSEAGVDQQMVTEIKPLINRHVALPTTQKSLLHATEHIDPTPNLPGNKIEMDIPSSPGWEHDRGGETIDLRSTFDQRFFGIVVPATRDGDFRPIVDESDFDNDGQRKVSVDEWLTPVPRYGAQLPVEFHHVALDRYDIEPTNTRSSLAEAAESDVLDGSLDKWLGAVPDILSHQSKQQLKPSSRRNNLPDILRTDIKAALDALTTELHRLERELSRGLGDNEIDKERIRMPMLDVYNVTENTDNDRAVTSDLLAATYIEKQAKHQEHRNRYADATAREILIEGQGVPVQVEGFENVEWEVEQDDNGHDIRYPVGMNIRCNVVFDDSGLSLLSPGDIAQRCKLTVDDEVGTNPFVLSIPVGADWESDSNHWRLRQRPQLTIEELEVDQQGRGEAVLSWQRRHPYARSPPFTHKHQNFYTPPSLCRIDPDVVRENPQDRDPIDIAKGSRFLLVKTADDYNAKKARNRLRALESGDDPFIDYLEQTLGFRQNLSNRPTDALLSAAKKHDLEPGEVLTQVFTLDPDKLNTLAADLEGDPDIDRDVLNDQLSGVPSAESDTTETAGGGINHE